MGDSETKKTAGKAEEPKKIRTYFDDVPEKIKEELSKSWGDRKKDTYGAADRHEMNIEVGDSFNKVVTFELEPGYYSLFSGIISTDDISPDNCDIGALCHTLISEMVAVENAIGLIPMLASDVCDWDSAYAKSVGANLMMRDAIIKTCIRNGILLTGGETANLGDQVRKKGMSWMFTLLSRYEGDINNSKQSLARDMDREMMTTFGSLADKENYDIVAMNGVPLLHIKRRGRYVLTADGTGSKSIECDHVGDYRDAPNALAMSGDDPTRDGAFPIAASMGIHAESQKGKKELIENMADTGMNEQIPLLGCVYHVSPDVSTYIMNCVVLSEVRKDAAQIGKKIKPGLSMVILYEEQRSNGITMQRRIFSETFGEKWYNVKVSDAFEQLKEKLGDEYDNIKLKNKDRTLGELVAQPSTPYFRADSIMPEKLRDTIKFRINVSSGGLFGKTRRLLEPLGLGADYTENMFNAPDLVLLLQMASQLEDSKGKVPDEVAYYTWGCGIGAVIGTTDPEAVKKYYISKGIPAKIAGPVTDKPEINILSKCLDSKLMDKPHIIPHKYSDDPLG